ncbi:ATP-binding protein [Plebeiibacterium sediminum]|uniref:histidine kinase n=1 Tax=Plebeiibacterium sediminum TaxID=2992112 RepID=A0AAE3M319_9BACT|nr:ATP-binding protein [Plebeiobacterium sediminum]MCW3786184.1 ATP-binding protein [Plebeiobacterium sediminum]
MRDIAMHILDIIGNSVRAKATLIEVSVIEKSKDDKLVLIVKDNGCGMDDKMIANALDPFFTSRKTRKVGLGIPLLQQNAQLSDGALIIKSKIGEGTTLEATFVRSHIDRPPLGDLPSTISLMISGNPSVEFVYTHVLDKEQFVLDSREIKQILEGVDITQPNVVRFLTQMVDENLTEIGVEL